MDYLQRLYGLCCSQHGYSRRVLRTGTTVDRDRWGQPDVAHRVFQCISNPRFLILMPSYDMVSSVCQALAAGGSKRCSEGRACHMFPAASSTRVFLPSFLEVTGML